jgi:predicted ATP-grasp superfamily ATP-dependent carboligase
VRLARSLRADAAAYGAPFENHPRAAAALGRDRALWGNRPDVLARARDPVLVMRALRVRGCAAAESRDTAPDDGGGRPWLRKRRASGGGKGVRRWSGRGRLTSAEYAQERIDGVPGSVTFVARGGRVAPLAVTRMLVGEAAFGASGMRYCGSILAPAGDPHFARGEALHEAAVALARAAAEGLSLVGANGVDFVARDGVPWAIEINPRWTAAMELAERARGLSVFALHAMACEGELREGALPAVRAAHGKAVLFARRDVVAPDTRGWLDDPDLRDIPHPGERIARGSPVCTILAEAPDAASCQAALARRAAAIYALLEPAPLEHASHDDASRGRAPVEVPA